MYKLSSKTALARLILRLTSKKATKSKRTYRNTAVLTQTPKNHTPSRARIVKK